MTSQGHRHYMIRIIKPPTSVEDPNSAGVKPYQSTTVLDIYRIRRYTSVFAKCMRNLPGDCVFNITVSSGRTCFERAWSSGQRFEKFGLCFSRKACSPSVASAPKPARSIRSASCQLHYKRRHCKNGRCKMRPGRLNWPVIANTTARAKLLSEIRNVKLFTIDHYRKPEGLSVESS